jgi:hypothetical protein
MFVENQQGRLYKSGIGDKVLRENVLRYKILNPFATIREIAERTGTSTGFVWKITSVHSTSLETGKVGRKTGYRKLADMEIFLLGLLIDDIKCTSVKQLREEWIKRNATDIPVNDSTIRRVLKDNLDAHKNQGTYVHPNKWKPENAEYYSQFILFRSSATVEEQYGWVFGDEVRIEKNSIYICIFIFILLCYFF